MNFLLLTVLLASFLSAWSQEIGNLEDRTKADVRIVPIHFSGPKNICLLSCQVNVLFTDRF